MIGRRHLAVIAGAPLLAACGGEDSASTSDPTDVASSVGTTPPGEVETTPVAEVADVPVGGGVVLGPENLVITQPVAGQFKAFSATCTHAGCQLASVTDRINCGCHGSTFALADGANTAGPNGSAAGTIEGLTPKFVEVKGSTIRVEV
ncbi:MAG: Rieske (2Fe-2S) protein [Nocardioides sp.]